MRAVETCVTCGTELVGRFCHACGEKRADARDLTLRAFAGYATEALTNADAKLYVTVRRLLRRPGLLTREFIAGRRTPYVGPLQLFLLANLIFFVLLQSGRGADTFTTDLAFHRGQPIYGEWAESMIRDRVGALPSRDGRPLRVWIDSWTPEQQDLRTRFNDASPRYANSLIILMIPLFAAATRLLRRRGLFVRDVVFSMHFFAFVLLFTVLVAVAMTALVLVVGGVAQLTGFAATPAARSVFTGFNAALNSELFIALVLTTTLGVYLVAGLRTAFGDSLPAALLRAIASLVLLFLVVTIYRAILFFVVFWAV